MTVTKTVNGYNVVINNVPKTAKRVIIATNTRIFDGLTDIADYVMSFDSANKAYDALIILNSKREKTYHLYI